MAITTTRTKDEFIALCDNALETAINHVHEHDLGPGLGRYCGAEGNARPSVQDASAACHAQVYAGRYAP